MAPRAISGSRSGHTPLLLHWSLTDGAGFAARQALRPLDALMRTVCTFIESSGAIR